MNVHTVSYLYSLPEFYALLRMTNCAGIPYYPQDEALFAPGLAHLEEHLLASKAGEAVTLDKISAFLARTVGESSQCVCVRTAGDFVGLYYASAATVLLRLRGEQWVVTPFERPDEGLEGLLESLPRKLSGGEISLLNRAGQWRCSDLNPETVPVLLRTAAQWAWRNEAPTGKDADLWKP